MLGSAPAPVRDPACALCDFCGPDRLALGGVSGHDVEVWSVADGTPRKRTTVGGWLLPLTAGGKLYTLRDVPGAPGVRHVVRYRLPPADRAQVSLGADGYRTRP